VIALWLGHENVETTQIYLHADLSIKERALARTTPIDSPPGRYRPPDTLLAFRSSGESLRISGQKSFAQMEEFMPWAVLQLQPTARVAHRQHALLPGLNLVLRSCDRNTRPPTGSEKHAGPQSSELEDDYLPARPGQDAMEQLFGGILSVTRRCRDLRGAGSVAGAALGARLAGVSWLRSYMGPKATSQIEHPCMSSPSMVVNRSPALVGSLGATTESVTFRSGS
jgi:hypothetical protein